jgi:hypothetical protein
VGARDVTLIYVNCLLVRLHVPDKNGLKGREARVGRERRSGWGFVTDNPQMLMGACDRDSLLCSPAIAAAAALIRCASAAVDAAHCTAGVQLPLVAFCSMYTPGARTIHAVRKPG